ncbi:hypothetical protein JIG36_51170 [Actinoplanes sp. LDG1-06]|uniref:Uncharacterized protein n=1 Tax=Paractinoplanes ovalisporus TaxID=2810368 RepID=A0ABS2AVI3_9ACTN|nr:hypothetical protein [Actinoplanes ovalisporus]MBM2623880.1 hypothetical protein [Actinoplanes ovalisporus]
MEAPPTPWARFAKKHAFLYAAGLTALVTAVATAVVTNGPKTLQSALSGDEPKVRVEDNSSSLTDLSLVYADEIDRPTGRMSAGLPRGGVKAGHTRTKIVVYNSTGVAIRITNLRARITKRSAPFSGALVARSSQGASSELIGIGLWQDPPVARTLASNTKLGGEAFFAVQSIDIGKEQTQVLEVTAIPDEHYYEYDIDISYYRNGEARTMTARDESMRVSGYAASYRSAFEPTGERYEQMSAEEVESWTTSHQLDG